MENLLVSLANTIESKDPYTQGHVERVSNLAVAVGRRFKLPEHEIPVLRLGGVLHDIGKIGVPEAILNKKGALSKEEWEVLKSHPELGYRICLPLKKHLGSALDMVRHHHEKLDGSGYPAGLRGGDIRQPARIMTVVDIFDALTTERSYHEARSRHEACDMLVKQSEDKKLDEEVVHHLISIVLG